MPSKKTCTITVFLSRSWPSRIKGLLSVRTWSVNLKSKSMSHVDESPTIDGSIKYRTGTRWSHTCWFVGDFWQESSSLPRTVIHAWNTSSRDSRRMLSARQRMISTEEMLANRHPIVDKHVTKSLLEWNLIGSSYLSESDSSNSNGHAKHHSTSKRNSSHIDPVSAVSDWSVPPTIELSPTSITSSSPDLSQNPLPADDSLVEFDSANHWKQSLHSSSRQNRSLSSSCPLLPSLTMCCSEPNEFLVKPLKSKSLSRLSNGSTVKTPSINQKRCSTTSTVSKISSSPRLRRRRRDHENSVAHHPNGNVPKLKPKPDNHQLAIKGLLNEMIEFVLPWIVLYLNWNSPHFLVAVELHLPLILLTTHWNPYWSHPFPNTILPYRSIWCLIDEQQCILPRELRQKVLVVIVVSVSSDLAVALLVVPSRTTSVNKKRPSLSQSLDLRSHSGRLTMARRFSRSYRTEHTCLFSRISFNDHHTEKAWRTSLSTSRQRKPNRSRTQR